MEEKYKKIKQLADFARLSQQQMGVLRSRIPLVEPKIYDSFEKVYIQAREALMTLETELYELLNKN